MDGTTAFHAEFLISLTCLYQFQDRALERHRPNQRKKNKRLPFFKKFVMLGAVIGLSAMAEEKVLGSPLLGTRTRVAADWCHAWSLLGQWSGWVTFPVPATGEWPRHGHLRGILDGYQKRQPNFHKWHDRPMNKVPYPPSVSFQAKLPYEYSLVIKCTRPWKSSRSLCVLPSYMVSVPIPGRLTELAHYGWMPLAAALFGTVKWLPQWMHHNFLPVIGLRVHAKVPPSPLTDRQLVALLGLWERKADRGLQCQALLQAVQLDFGLQPCLQ